MASIDAWQFKRLGEGDIADCVALSAEAGWNQTIEDWTVFLRHGTVFGLPADDGVTVGTGAVLPYSDGFCLDQHGAGHRRAAARTDWH